MGCPNVSMTKAREDERFDKKEKNKEKIVEDCGRLNILISPVIESRQINEIKEAVN